MIINKLPPPLNFSTFNSTTSLNIEHNNDNASFANKFKIFIRDVFVYDKKIKNPKRIEFIDLAKGICIMLVVMMHSGLGNDWPAISALRMPLYFVLSGLFFKDYGSFYNLLEKKINKLLVPFIFFFMIGLVIYWITNRAIYFYPFYVPFVNNYVINFPIWFLISLFEINLIFCAISLNVHSIKYQFLIVSIIGGIGFLLSIKNIYLPLFLVSSFDALPFFFVGYLLRKTPILYPNKYDKFNLLISITILCACIYFAVILNNPHIDFLFTDYYGNPLTIYILSTGLVLGFLLLCKSIIWLPIISYCGRYSIIILGLHMEYIDLIRRYIGITDALTLFILSITLCFICIPIMRAYVPKFVAQTDLLSLPRFKKLQIFRKV